MRESPSPRLEAVIDIVDSIWGRLSRVWSRLGSERRLAALAAVGLFVTLFLPWYQETVIARGVTNLRSLSDSMTGWGAFSFVEAAVLLVAAGVIALLFVRAEGRAFHVPGGDGGVITAAGAWSCVLILWRMFDKQGTSAHGLYTTTSGIEWGIFVALAVAGLLTYAGSRIRLARELEPPLPGQGARGTVEGGPLAGGAEEGAAASSPEDDGTWVLDAPRTHERPSRMIEFDLDDTWVQVEGSSRMPADSSRMPGESSRTPDPPAAAPADPGIASATSPTAAAAAPTAAAPPTAPTARRRPRSIADPQPDDQLAGRRHRPD
ncbi:MAG: hypothetical protein ACR2NR_10325 [Solirubrobacteraceae bacterium]